MAINYHPIIEKEAYLLWEKAGCPEGKSDFFWNLAKTLVKARKKEKELEDEVDYQRRRAFLNSLVYKNL